MKITFIEPRTSGVNVYSKFALPLLGPVYLGTILAQRGHRVEIYNENILEPDYENLDTDLVGISILTPTANRGYEIARKFPKEKVIIGGVHASHLPQEAIKFARQVVIGEGEHEIVDVVEGRNGAPFVYGRTVEDLDTLPRPDYSLVKGLKLPMPITPVSTSRGCPFDCNFCSVNKIFGRAYRFRSPEKVVDEMVATGSKRFFFCDDNFAAHTRRTEKLLSLMNHGKKFEWAAQVRTDVARDAKLLDLMSQAGCKVVCVGLESVNPETLKLYRKKQTVSQITDAIKSFHRKKIMVHGMFVLGSDTDNKKTIADTLKFSIKAKIDTVQYMVLTPLPGTEVYDSFEKENRIFTKDWSLYNGQHVVFHPKQLTSRQLQEGAVRAMEKFYSVFKSLLLLARGRFRNAAFRLMGHWFVKKWKRQHGAMDWLARKLQSTQSCARHNTPA